MVTPGDASARTKDTSAGVSASICDAEASDPSDLRRARLSITASPRLGWHTYERRLAELPVHASGYGCWERRMREIRTSGATRGGDLSPPTLPSLRPCVLLPPPSLWLGKAEEPRRVVAIDLLQDRLLGVAPVDPPAPWGWNRGWSVVEILVGPFEEAEVDFVQLVAEDLLRRLEPERRWNGVGPEEDAVLVAIEEPLRGPPLPAGP